MQHLLVKIVVRLPVTVLKRKSQEASMLLGVKTGALSLEAASIWLYLLLLHRSFFATLEGNAVPDGSLVKLSCDAFIAEQEM